MAVSRITPWAVNGPTANYGLTSSLSGTATLVPAGALIVTSVEAQTTTQPSVSDTAGNAYTVVLGESSSTRTSVWIAYCLSAIANSANVVTWTAGSSVLTGAQGATYTTSSGTWAFDTSVAGLSAYATPLSLSITTTGAGVVYGGFGEYYTGADVWSVTGLTAQASQPGSSTGNGNMGCLLADDITTGAVSGLSISVSDANATYGGYIAGVVGSFVVSSGGNTATGAITEHVDTATGSASPTAGASAAITEGLDHAAAAAAAIVGASGAVTEHADTASASASVTLPSAAGAVTEHADTIATAASSTVSASAAIPEGHDAISAAASPLLAASAAIPEGHDTVAGVASPLAQGSGAVAEGLDAFAARATLSTGIAGEGDIFEGRDILAASASAIAGASAALTEGHDAVASAGSVMLPAAQGAVVESRDSAAGTATVTYPSAVGTIREGLDAATGTLSVTLPTAAGAALEGMDTVASRASVYAGVFGSGRVTEGTDGVVGAALSGAGPALPGDPYYYAALPVRAFYAPIAVRYFYMGEPVRLFYTALASRPFYAALPVRWFYALSNPNMTTRLDIKDPRETVVITLDATNDLATGETLATITNVSITVATGVDPRPALALSQVQVNTSAITLGVNTVAIGKGVQAVCTSGLNAVTYLIAITVATTNTDKVLTLKAFLPVSSS